jgi:hypothetical protein
MSNLYQIYRESVERLAATLVVKDEATCDIINSRLRILGEEVLADSPETWKYYLNLSGQYHITDTLMKVVSMDTHEEIDFTRENMGIHRATWRGYQYGSRYYAELLTKYPRQDSLIFGILNPVNIATATAAADHSILYFDSSLIEGRETNLIHRLQRWIDAQFTRWAMEDFRINNSLFIAARLLILFQAMSDEIENIRTDNCRTNMVHSYHIRRYLASFGPLDQYYNEMNEFQRLYFYRNIRYIMRNNGKDEIFQELIGNVMTERRFPLAEYRMQHYDGDIKTTLEPTVQYLRSSVNGIPAALGEDIRDTDGLLELQNPLARNNFEESTYASDYVPKEMVRSLASEAKTKSFESNVLDLAESEPYTLAEILLNQWIYLADLGRYRSVMTLTLPNGGESFKLNMKEAFLVYQYCYMLRAGITLPTIPRIMAKRVRRMPIPTFDELRAITTKKVTSDAFIHEAMRDNVNITSYVSVDAFLNLCITIQKRMLRHRDLYVYRDDLHAYAEVQLMTNRFYADIPVDMDHGQVYSEWLGARGLSLEGYTPAELDEIMVGILNTVTGFELRTSLSVSDIQKAMLSIMSRLSSYSVQFIQQINAEAVVMLDWGHVRWHYLGGSASHILRIQPSLAVPMSLHAKAKLKTVIDLSVVAIRAFDQKSSDDFDMAIGVDMGLSGMNQYISKGLAVGALVGTLSQPTVNLSVLGGTVMTIPSLVSQPLADLFDRTETNVFANP